MVHTFGWESVTTGHKRIRSGRGHRIIDFVWLIIPTITLIAVAAYIVGAIVLRANPPALAVQSQSMSPTIPQGDLSIIRSTNIAGLKTGNIIAIKLTAPEQSKYHLPGEIIRRIVKIERVNGSEIFVTKGDGNPTNDPFTVAKYAIAGKVIASVPDLGFPILFFSSKQGIIFLISTAVILLIYYILGFLEDRRHYAHATAATMQNVMEMVGYVHDAVQQNQSKALEQIAFTKEQLRSLSERELSTPGTQIETSNKEESSPNRKNEDEGKVPINPQPVTDIKEELAHLLQRSMELRKAAEWASEGDLGPEHLYRLFIKAAGAIELLLSKFDDQELQPPPHGMSTSSISISSDPEMQQFPISKITIDNDTEATTHENAQKNLTSSTKQGSAETELDTPTGGVISAEPLNPNLTHSMTQLETMNVPVVPNDKSSDRECVLVQNDGTDLEGNDITRSNGFIDGHLTFYSPTDDQLLSGDDEIDIFANQYGIFDSDDEDLFEKPRMSKIHDEPSEVQPLTNKRHHRRTIRRRN